MPTLKARAQLAWKAAVGQFSDDSAKQAWGMLSGIMPGGLGTPPNRGTAEYLRAYSEMPWLRAVAGRVATSMASVEWCLYVRKKGNEKARRDVSLQRAKAVRRKALMKAAETQDDLKEITEHPLLDLLHGANSFQTGEAMRKVTSLHLDLVGEAFWLKERGSVGEITALWPIPPHWVINTPTPTNRFFRVQFRAWRGMIPDTEILWIADPDPLNPYGRGTGITQALGDELETDEYAAKHTKAFFYNRARPDLLVWPKSGQMRPEQTARLEEDWLSRSQGFWKAFKPYFLTREVGVKELEQNFRSQQLVQVREHERNAIIQVFGMPPELLGVIENSNRATINAADYLYSKYVLEPRLEFLRAVLQERLVPEFDERLIIDYISPVQDDKDQQLEAARVAPFALSVDEWRKHMGHEPLENGAGEMHMIPHTVQPSLMDMKLTEPPPEPADAGRPPRPGAPSDEERAWFDRDLS